MINFSYQNSVIPDKLFLLFILFLLSSCAIAQNDTLNVMGMNYHDARKVVLQNGWLPAKILPPYENISAVAHDFRDFGYTEVLDCAGAGTTSPCIFYFQNSEGKYLKIGTEGEHISRHASPRVVYTEILNQID